MAGIMQINNSISINKKGIPIIYGIIHLFIDASTVGLLFGVILYFKCTAEQIYFYILLYNFIAFGLQPVFGYITDLLKTPKTAAVSGILFILASFFFYFHNPVTAIVLTSIGNALFHVGGGVINLFVTPKKAISPGIFVAPGAIGLGLGLFLGKKGLFILWPFAIILIISAILIIILKTPKTYSRTEEIKMDSSLPYFAVLLFLISIFFRALIGSTQGYTLEKNVLTLVVLSLIAFSGKALGGVFSDKFGWIKVSVGALLLSCPFLALNYGNLAFAAIGMLFFQMTMPVTLTATAGIMPKNPGLAFGLNCLALFSGMLFKFFPVKYFFYNPITQIIFILIASLIVFFGLFLLNKKTKIN